MISKIGYTLIFSNDKESKKVFTLPLLCLMTTVFGIIFSSASAYNLPFNMIKISIVATLFAMLEYFILVFFKKYKIIASLILITIWAIISYVLRDALLKGSIQMFSFISETIEQSQEIGWEYQNFVNYDNKLMELTFIVSLLPVILILTFSLFGKPNILVWLFVVIPMIEPMLFFNQLPCLWSFLMLIVAGVTVLILSNTNLVLKNDTEDIRNARNVNAAAIMIAITLSVFLIATLLLVNENGYNTFLNKVPGRISAKNNIIKTLSPTFEEKPQPQGGITGGDFSKTDKFTFTGENALILEADKLMGNLYIRGFVGGNYTSKGWEETEVDSDKFVDIIRLDGMELSNLFHSQIRDLKITLGEAAEQKYDYEPYFVIDRKGKNFQYLEIANYDNNLFLLSKQDIYNSLLNSIGVSKGQVSKDIVDKCFRDEHKYFEKVKSNYLEVPKSASSICKEYAPMADKFNNVENVIKYVMGDLASRANYTLSPGATPVNKDFVTYFLYENKKGYCTHFASTAVLIFRSMGIPARYAEGYVVNASDYASSTQTKDNKYLINVKDTASHAWCEVYLEGGGWIPVEVTPGLTPMPTGDIADAKGDSIEYEGEGKTKSNQIAVETPTIENQEAENSLSENGGLGNEANSKGDGRLRPLHIILEIAISLILIAACIGMFRYISVRKWNIILESNDKKIAILGWFKLFKITYKDNNYISLIRWGKELEENGLFIKDTISPATNVVQKIAYSNSETGNALNISEKEFECARKNFVYCIYSVYKGLTILEKVKWIFVLRLPLPKKEYKKSLESKGNCYDA